MKKIVSFLLTFLAVLSLIEVSGQNNTSQPVYAPLGVQIKPGQSAAMKDPSLVSYVFPANTTTEKLFCWYTSTGLKCIDLSATGAGVVYQPGIGLNISQGPMFNLNQSPASLGNITVNSLEKILDNPPFIQLNTGSNLLIRGGDQRVGIVRWDDFITSVGVAINNLGLGSGGGGPGLRWVNPPQNENSPGEIGDYSYYAGNFYMVGRNSLNTANQWFQWAANPSFNSGYLQSQTGKPGLNVRYEGSTNVVVSEWSYAGSDVASWDVFWSVNDSLNFSLLKGGIAAGDRSYSFNHVGNAQRYYITVRGQKSPGNLTPFSDKREVIIPVQNGYQPVTNVAINPRNGQNSFDFFFNTSDAGGIASLYISKNINANPASDEGWSKVSDLTITTAGSYSIPVTGINDTEGRVFKIRRSGDRSPSAYQKFGPAALSNTGEFLLAPMLTGQVGPGNSISLAYNTNNAGTSTATIQRSSDGGLTWTKDISVPPLNGAGSANDADVIAGSTYHYRMVISKNGQSSPFSGTISFTVPGGNSSQVCNFSENAQGRWDVVTKSFDINFNGKVYYMLNALTIPDQLIVKKNGIVFKEYIATSNRTAGEVSVSNGDKIDFIINPKVTFDKGTAWQFFANCSTPYNVNGITQGDQGSNEENNRYPTISKIESIVSGNNRTFNITTVPSPITGKNATRSQAVKKVDGQEYTGAGFVNSLTLTKDKNGTVLDPNAEYTVYVGDDQGRIFGIANVNGTKDYGSDQTTAEALKPNLVSQSPSSVVYNVDNPSSNRSYNASIYSDDPSVSGSFVYGWFNQQAVGGNVSLDITNVPLTPGKKYRIYPAEYNGEPALQRQTRGGNYVEFVRTTGNGTGKQADVLILGNSITNHGPSAGIGWNTDPTGWGMAASSRAKDWVHLFESYAKGLNSGSTVTIGDSKFFETTYDQNFDFQSISQQTIGKEYGIIQLGDNTNDGTLESRNFSTYLGQFIDAMRNGSPQIQILITTAYWQVLPPHPKYDEIIKQVAVQKTNSASRVFVADLAGLDTWENSANTQLPDAQQAVKNHPGDRGHAAIANVVFQTYQFAQAVQVNPTPSPGVGRPVTVSEPTERFQNLGKTIFMSTPLLTIGVSREFGGSLTYLKNNDLPSGQENIINNYDKGRQVQQSWYAGPSPFFPTKPDGSLWQKHTDNLYNGFPWNPVQAGDIFNNPARIDQLDLPTAANNWTLYVRSYSYNWAFNAYAPNNGQGDHILESWYQFIEDDVVKVRYKITTNRTDGFTHENASQNNANERFEGPAVILERNYQHWWGNPATDSKGLGPTLFNGYYEPSIGQNKYIPENGGAASGATGQSYPVKDYWFTATRNPNPNEKGLGIFAIDYPADGDCNCYLFTQFNYTSPLNPYRYQDFPMSYGNFTGPPLRLYGVGATGEYTFGIGNWTPTETKQKYERLGMPHGTGRPRN